MSIKPKTYLVPLIAVLVFSVLMFVASYAYFNASVSTTNVANIRTNIAEYNLTVTSSSTSCGFTVSEIDMLKGKSNDSIPVGSATCNLSVTLNGTSGVPYVYV